MCIFTNERDKGNQLFYWLCFGAWEFLHKWIKQITQFRNANEIIIKEFRKSSHNAWIYTHYARNTIFTTRKTDYTIIIFEISAFQWYMTFLPSRSPLVNINFIYFLNGKTDTLNFACIFYDIWYSKGKKTIMKSCTK